MTKNISYLTDYEEIDRGYVAFRGNPKGGKITRKCTIKTGNLDFENVHFVRELKFNLFSVSQMCDKKNSVLFNDTECIVLSPNFKLIDESQVLLRIPRKNNMYSVDLKNIVPKGGLTCLFAKATFDESKLWHRRLCHLNFKTMDKLVKGNLVRGLPSKLFENDQTCVACQKEKQHRAFCKSKTENSISLLLHLLHMDLFGPTFVKSIMKKMYCLVVIDDYNRFTWVFFLATKDETSGILKSFITGIENLVDYKVKVIRCDNGTEFKNKEMNQFCEMKGILRQFSVSRTPQQNGVAERRNKILIAAARTMLADSKLPITFWAAAVNTACYVQNRVLVVKPHNNTPYELFHGKTPILSFMRPLGCPVTILNTIDHLGKFDGKADEGFFVGYSLNSKAFRVFNSKTRIVEENLHIGLSESTPNVVGSGLDWLFDIDALTRTMNYEPIIAGTQSNGFASTKASDNACQARKETEPVKNYILLPLWTADPSFSQDPKSSHDDGSKPSSDDGKKDDEDPRKDGEYKDQEKEDTVNNTNTVNAAGTNEVNAVGGKTSIELPFDPNMPALEDYNIFDFSRDNEDDDAVADMNNLDTTIQVSPNPTTRIHKDHHLNQVIGDLQSATQTRKMSKNFEEHRRTQKGNSCIEGSKLDRGYAGRASTIQVTRKGIDSDEVFAPVARTEAIRLFLAYALFKNFVVYQIDVKSDFIYGKIKEEVYVCQPPGFKDLNFPDKVYKVEKALYGLHQAPRAWYETLSTYLLDNRFQRGKIDMTLFIKRHKGDILLVQVYVDDIIFGSTKKELCNAFEKLMHEKFQMSYMGELTFFLGLQAIVKVKTVNGEVQLQSLVDGKKIIITKSTVRRDLQLEDAEDEAIYKELGNSLVRAATTASCLEAEQDNGNITKTRSKAKPNEAGSLGTTLGGGPRCQETMGDTIAQTRFENVSKLSNDPLLARGNTLQSGEDSLKHNELMKLCTNLQQRVLDLEKTKTTQQIEIDSFKRRVNKLEKKRSSRSHKLKRLYKISLSARVESSGDEDNLGEDASKQGRRINAIDEDDDITLVNDQDDNETFDADTLTGYEVFTEQEVAAKDVNLTIDDVTLAQALAALKSGKPKVKGDVIEEPSVPVSAVSASTKVSAATTTTIISTPRKGIFITKLEPEKPMKKKDQISFDEETAKRLQAKFDEEVRLAREKDEKEQEANIALIEEWDDIQAKINVDHQLAERLQAQEQEELSDAEKATLIQ
ncbi:putative ribonuclease H-like domain-containing protein [Tanacetum coccineum]